MRATFALCLFGGALALSLTACGNGDDNSVPPPSADAGPTHDGSASDGSSDAGDGAVADGGASDGGAADGEGLDGTMALPDSSGGDASDASDGGACDFAAFVIGLIDADTTSSALPSSDLGQSCVDQQNQAQFSSLFP